MKYKIGDKFKLRKEHDHYWNTRATMISVPDDIVEIVDVDESLSRSFDNHVFPYRLKDESEEGLWVSEEFLDNECVRRGK